MIYLSIILLPILSFFLPQIFWASFFLWYFFITSQEKNFSLFLFFSSFFYDLFYVKNLGFFLLIYAFLFLIIKILSKIFPLENNFFLFFYFIFSNIFLILSLNLPLLFSFKIFIYNLIPFFIFFAFWKLIFKII
ncbi:MAG: hypothetical protein RQ894_00115 [Candidatus Pacebacteria bacterium]|nr:hypothetical protein [Candidatus Paceibacterota bacterium]